MCLCALNCNGPDLVEVFVNTCEVIICVYLPEYTYDTHSDMHNLISGHQSTVELSGGFQSCFILSYIFPVYIKLTNALLILFTPLLLILVS